MKRLKDFFADNRFELQTFGFLCAFSATVWLWTEYKPQNYYVQLAFALVCLGFGLGFYFSYRALWRNKWRRPFILGARRMLVGASHYLMKFLNRISIFRSRGNLVTGRTSVSYNLSVIRRQEKRRRRKDSFKPPRWKDMENARQKLGFLYYRVISEHIKHGTAVTSHETPLEISKRISKSDAESELFDMYISARYDDRKELDENEIAELKDRLFD